MSSLDPYLPRSMPAPAPMAMLTQDLGRAPMSAVTEPEPVAGTAFYRWMTFLPAFGTAAILAAILSDWFSKDGFQIAEVALLMLVIVSAFWIALSVAASAIGLLAPVRRGPNRTAGAIDALDVALLVPVYNEDPAAVFDRIRAMQSDLSSRVTHHRFAFFILSDTRCDLVAAREWREFRHLAGRAPGAVPLFYRRRADNIERKTGNIRDWVEQWGSAWDAFITLDADSLMSANAIVALADGLSNSPRTGLVQTVPHLIGAGSLFARIQQFANNTYGGLLARGLERWCGSEGNYWGHNAIVRTAAFASSAGLPRLAGKGALSGTIKSHDFVEAALLRRNGWAVELRPDITESYEETPQSIVDHVLRDRRWCQGNLQHLRLLRIPGLKPASRFHMLQGAMAYLASLVWFALLILFTLMGKSESETVFRYFTDENPLFPQWPQMDAVSRTVILCFVLGLLVLPKFLAIGKALAADPSCRLSGGPARFLASSAAEITLSFLLAPILMVQHVLAIIRTLINLDTGWSPQNRGTGCYGVGVLMRFHAMETVIGGLLVTAIVLEVASPWLVPIAASLVLAVPFSWISSRQLPSFGMPSWLMATAEDVEPSRIIRLAETSERADDIEIQPQPTGPAPLSQPA